MMSVQPDPKVLVVGTTADYIHWIRKSCPGQAVFITDPGIRSRAEEPCPRPQEEILCDLSDYNQVQRALQSHLMEYGLQVAGVACFDCESMELAAVLADRWELPYPSMTAISNCRNKYRSKILWQSQNLQTPPVAMVRTEEDAIRFMKELQAPVVLKPLSGSGSELIFACSDENACRLSYQQIRNGLNQRSSQRLYAGFSPGDPQILAEGLVKGEEFSCDFAIQDGRCNVIRLARKIRPASGPFGTTRAYLLPAELPPGLDDHRFNRTLTQSAATLGIKQAICMLDFIVDRGRMVLLELAPRPGGDCLPFLLHHACHLDMLKLQLDFARKKPIRWHQGRKGTEMVGLRVHARQGGVLKAINTCGLASDPRISEIHLPRRPGHRITLPPEDYDAWLLGHIIFAPDGHSKIEEQCRDLLAKIRVEVEPL